MLFLYPLFCNTTYYQSDILTCKTCFKELAEEYFGKFKDQYQELFNEVTEIVKSDECSKKYGSIQKKKFTKFNKLTTILIVS
jgi:hypothetical protein